MSDCIKPSSKDPIADHLPDLFQQREGEAAYQVLKRLIAAGFSAYLVGGCVRNFLLSLPIVDYDIATSARPDQVKQLFPRTIDTGIRFGTVTVIQDRVHLEVTTFRSESTYGDTRHPDSVHYEDSIELDLSRRDFTMNALACSIDGTLIDPYGGQLDIEHRVIRCVGNPLARMREDLLRCVRAFRFAAQLGFSIHPDTLGAIRACEPVLETIARERVGVEWRKVLQHGEALPLEQMVSANWMRVWDMNYQEQQELAWFQFRESCRTILDPLSRIVLLASLIGKTEEELLRWLRNLRYSRKDIQASIRLLQLVSICRGFDTNDFQKYTSGDQTFICKLRHILFEYGYDFVVKAYAINTDLHAIQATYKRTLLPKADTRRDDDQPVSVENDWMEGMIRSCYEGMPIHASDQLAVSGNDLILALQRPGGPWIKELIEKLTECVLCSDLENEIEALLSAAKKLLREENSR